MPFEHPHTTPVETKDLHFMLSQIQQVKTDMEADLPTTFYPDRLNVVTERLEHTLGLDRAANHAED